MTAILIVAIVLLIGLYVIWRLRPAAGVDSEDDSSRGERLRTFRRPVEGSGPPGKLVVEFTPEFTPERDLSTEASEELSIAIPEADINFARYPEFHEDHVVLIARDSETLFAYWEVTFEAVDRYSRTTGDRTRPKIILRIYDAQDVGGAPRYIDIDVNSRLGNYYLPVPMLSRAFYAEIGLLGSRGFWPVARSGIAEVPKSVFRGSRLDEYAAKAMAGLGVSSW